MAGIKGMRWGTNKERMKRMEPRKRRPVTSKRRSRELARMKYEKTHNIDLPECIVVHHIDGNPFNNNIENLNTMEVGQHTKHHHPAKPKIHHIPKRKIQRLEKRLRAYFWAIDGI